MKKSIKSPYDIPNLRLISVKYATDRNGNGLIRLSEKRRYNDRTTQTKTFPRHTNGGDVIEQGFQILLRNGWNPVCRASDIDSYYILCNNWSDEFKEIKDLK
jgi:hypothetical protein